MGTKIEWATNADGVPGETWNPVTGCTKISEGCEHCYAERMAKRLRGRCGYPADNPFRVTLHPERLGIPLHWKKARTVFVCSMSDLFHQDVPLTYNDHVFNRMARCPQHRFLVLTKRPEPMREYLLGYRPSEPLPNVGLGVTVESQDHEDRIAHLLACPAAMRFVSVEPMLGGMAIGMLGIDWVIGGGESGPGARPMDPRWARDLRDQCVAAGVPFFFKQWGGVHKKKHGRELDGRTWNQRPAWFGEAAKEKDND